MEYVLGTVEEFNEAEGVASKVVFSRDRKYRYYLERIWEPALPLAVFCMLNPSTADAFKNDPTVRRCYGFARSWGKGGIVVVNIFALRSTNPAGLKSTIDPVGTGNDDFIMAAARASDEVICAWGTKGSLNGRAKRVRDMMFRGGIKTVCLEKTNDGYPKHPLYVSGNVKTANGGLTLRYPIPL